MMLEPLLARYGLPALFLGAGLEGETVVTLGGIMVHRGLISFGPAVTAAALGSFLADQAFFALGRKYRDHKWVRRMRERPAFSRALTAIERHPTSFVFAFRFLYGLRTVSPVAIGTTRIATLRFVAINALAAIVWATTFVTLGYLFGQAIEAAFGRVKALEHILIPADAAILLATAALHFWRRKNSAR